MIGGNGSPEVRLRACADNPLCDRVALQIGHTAG
jgi:hypothetical protein